MTKFTDSRVLYLDDYAPNQFDPLDDDLLAEDPDYNEAYLRQHSDSVWSLPNTPLMLTVDLEAMDAQDRLLLSAELEIEPAELEYLELYVERIQGDVQSLVINETHFASIDDIPPGLKNYLDTIYFGKLDEPVITVAGSRVNLWDAIRGEPETQQAFFLAGYDPSDSQMQLSGVLDSNTALERMENLSVIKLRDTFATRIIDAQVAAEMHKPQQLRSQAKGKKDSRVKKWILGVCILVIVGTIAALVLIGL